MISISTRELLVSSVLGHCGLNKTRSFKSSSMQVNAQVQIVFLHLCGLFVQFGSTERSNMSSSRVLIHRYPRGKPMFGFNSGIGFGKRGNNDGLSERIFTPYVSGYGNTYNERQDIMNDINNKADLYHQLLKKSQNVRKDNLSLFGEDGYIVTDRVTNNVVSDDMDSEIEDNYKEGERPLSLEERYEILLQDYNRATSVLKRILINGMDRK